MNSVEQARGLIALWVEQSSLTGGWCSVEPELASSN